MTMHFRRHALNAALLAAITTPSAAPAADIP